MIQKLLAALSASVRDIILAGVAAASGYLLAVNVIPRTSAEFKALLAGALYAGIRAAVAFAVALIK